MSRGATFAVVSTVMVVFAGILLFATSGVPL